MACRRRPGGPRGNRFSRHHTRESLVDQGLDWIEEHGEFPRQSDWNAWRANFLADLNQEKADEWRLIAVRAADYPSVGTVRELFGTWAAFIEALGCVPRRLGQRTARRQKASPLLATLAVLIRAVYAARTAEDVGAMRRGLRALAEEATRLEYSLTDEGAEQEMEVA